MTKAQQQQQMRGLRSVLTLLVLTAASAYTLHGRAIPPRGNPLLYSLATSWLISLTIALLTSAILFRLPPPLFSLARWESEGKLYNRAGVQAFRWILLHSPLGWINSNYYVGATRADFERLLRETNSGEGVHWLTCIACAALAIWHLVHGYAVYGTVLLLIRIPFDLYPIMLQRWNRGRIQRALNRIA